MNHKTKVWGLRILHIIGAFFLIFCSGALIYSGITGIKLKYFTYYFSAVSLEALAVIINRWDCPLHPLHEKLGDNKGFFGLFMPKKHTRKAMIFAIYFGAFAIILGLYNILKY